MAGYQRKKTLKTTEIKVKLNIHPGPVSPTQKHAWNKFWAKLFGEARNSVRSQNDQR
jgi:hypothetical protein